MATKKYASLNTITELANQIKSKFTALQTNIDKKANTSDLTSHTSNKSNPHGVTLSQLGVTATVSELNKMDGITATTTELNYVDGVTSNIQTQLNGKAASTHNHGLLHTDFTKQINDTTTNSGWLMINDSYSGFLLKSLRTQKEAPDWTIGNYSAGIAFGGADTKGVITHAYNSPQIRFAGGNGSAPVWNFTLNASSGKKYTLPSSDGTIALTSSNITGNAASATKLQTARNINLGSDLTGSASFNGSSDITISAKHYNVSVGSGNKSNYPYHRFAYKGSKASPITGQHNDTDAIFCIRETYNTGGYGILKVSLRTNSSTSVSQASATWLARYNFDLSDVQIGLYDVAGATYADLYIKVGTYARMTVTQLEGNRSWTLLTSNEVNNTTTSDPLTSTECYVSIESAATTLHGQAYASIISSVDGGKVAESAKLGSSTVGSATQPIYLNNGTATKCTYTLEKSVPSDAVFTDTNTKVTNTLATTTKAYVTGTTSSSTNTGTQVFDTGVYLDTTAGKLTATTFNGTTFSGSGIATILEVKTYLGI